MPRVIGVAWRRIIVRLLLTLWMVGGLFMATAGLRLSIDGDHLLRHASASGLHRLFESMPITVENLGRFCQLLTYKRRNLRALFFHDYRPLQERAAELLRQASEHPALHPCLFPVGVLLRAPAIARHFFPLGDEREEKYSPHYGGNLLGKGETHQALHAILRDRAAQDCKLHLAIVERAVARDFSRMQEVGLLQAFIQTYPHDMHIFGRLMDWGHLMPTILALYLQHHAHRDDLLRALLAAAEAMGEPAVQLTRHKICIALDMLRQQGMLAEMQIGLGAASGDGECRGMSLEDFSKFAQAIDRNSRLYTEAWLVLAEQLVITSLEAGSLTANWPSAGLAIDLIPRLLEKFHYQFPAMLVRKLALMYARLVPQGQAQLKFLAAHLVPMDWQPLSVRLNAWFRNGPLARRGPVKAGLTEEMIRDCVTRGVYPIERIHGPEARAIVCRTSRWMDQLVAASCGHQDETLTAAFESAYREALIDLVFCWTFLVERGERTSKGLVWPLTLQPADGEDDTWEAASAAVARLVAGTNGRVADSELVSSLLLTHLVQMRFYDYLRPTELASLIANDNKGIDRGD